jgi:hypothetical protein
MLCVAIYVRRAAVSTYSVAAALQIRKAACELFVEVWLTASIPTNKQEKRTPVGMSVFCSMPSD